MHHLAGKAVATLAFVALAFFAGACGGDQEDPIQVNDEDVECESDEECEGDQVCNIADDPEDNECVEDTAGAECEDDDDCHVFGQRCIDEECQYVEHQCSTVGEECEQGEPTAEGFACADLGRGERCYETCNEARVCADGAPAMQLYCNRGEACVSGGEEHVCQPSECDGYFDTEEGCQELRTQNPEAVKDGEHCVRLASDTYVCRGAGDAGIGDQCDGTADCAEGLTCVNSLTQNGDSEVGSEPGSLGDDSFCARACESDDVCEDGRSCIGEDAGVYDGVGFCGDRCEPFEHGSQQCGDDTACVPVSSQDGVCHRTTTNESDYYEECESTDECPDNAHCAEVVGEPRQCLPLCDPTLASQDERNATCPGPDGDRELGGECLDMATDFDVDSDNYDGSTQIGSGVCFESCLTSDEWGQGKCTGEDRGCRKTGWGIGRCTDVGDAERGESCESTDECADGLHCDIGGEDGGTCRSLCQPDEQTNDALGCQDHETCIRLDSYDNLGECRLPCDPGQDGTDPNCPQGQQTCIGTGDQAYCLASGDLAHGEECGTPEEQNCAPGMVCARSEIQFASVVNATRQITGPFEDDPEQALAEPTCRQVCEPFVGEFGDSGCPDGYACSPMTPNGPSSTAGHCVPQMDDPIQELALCPEAELGNMCDENAFCIASVPNQCADPQFQCLQFCDYRTGAGCTGDTECEQALSDGALFGWMGICL